MIRKCSMTGCNSQINEVKQVNKIRFYRFPLRRPDVLSKWLEVIDRPDFKPNEYNVICGNHFEKEDFKIDGSAVKLKMSAIPKRIVSEERQFIDLPEIFQKELNDKCQTTVNQRTRLILLKTKSLENNVSQETPTNPTEESESFKKICVGVQADFLTEEIKLKRKLRSLQNKLRKKSQEIQELRSSIFQFVPKEKRKKLKNYKTQ